MKLSTALTAAAILLSAGSTQAAGLPLTVQMQVVCLPFVEGRRPLEDLIALAQRTGYPNRVNDGVFTRLSGPAGRLTYGQMLDGRRNCDFERPQGAYRQLVADFKAWTGRAPGGPWVQTGPEGPEVDGERGVSWIGAGAVVEITEDYDAEDRLTLFVIARSKP